MKFCKEMTFSVCMLAASAAYAGETDPGYYMANAFNSYGYGSAAAIFQGSDLKAGRLGYKADNMKENNYYPGFASGNPCEMLKK